MHKLYRSCLIILLVLFLNPAPVQAGGHNKEAVREAFSSILHKAGEETYINLPLTENPYEAGLLSGDTLEAALDTANFIRWLAGLEEIRADEGLNGLAQHGAVLMAANKSLSHDPEKPGDMDDAFFQKGHAAAASCNLIMFNWNEEGLLSEAVRQFARDDGAHNRTVLGHRRWMLYPGMAYTGFGLAQDADGRSYAAMYVMDSSREETEYDLIRWPSAGAFPAEYLSVDTPWSISPNPDVYDLSASVPRIEMREETTGTEYTLDIMEGIETEEQYFILGGGRYGDGPVYIFHPDLNRHEALMYGYQQNQVWTVRLSGMVYADGRQADEIRYTVEMISLTPIAPAAVEIMPRELTLGIGEQMHLSGQVIPDWADDLTLLWRTGNADVAVVDEAGVVRGVGAGECEIIAESVNGKDDRIRVTVTE